MVKGHSKALNMINKITEFKVYLGTGCGTTVLQLLNTFEKVNNVILSYSFKNRRLGDICICVCCSDKAHKELGWKAELSGYM